MSLDALAHSLCKIMRKPELAEQGHDRMTGALAEKEQQQDDAEDVSCRCLLKE